MPAKNDISIHNSCSLRKNKLLLIVYSKMVRMIFASMQLVPYVACNFLKNFQAGKWKYDKWYDKYQSNLNCSLINWKNVN